MTSIFIILFILPLLITLAMTPVMIRVAHKLKALDYPDKRKVHSDPIPRLGGIAIALSFFTSLGILFIWFPDFYIFIGQEVNTTILIGFALTATLLILVLGAWDDINTLQPGIKFFIQFIAASLAYFSGFNISLVSDPIGPGFINLDWFSYPLTVLWIVGITNAFNLIDGLDGLASGTAFIALATIGTITFFYGQIEIVFVTLILAGAVSGFLWYNFRPARIFLGDSGSLFLGFILALLSIQSFTKVTTSFAILVPFFALGLPIMDTFLSMIRRFFSWFMPERYAVTNKVTFKEILSSIFQPDKSHVHHQLLQKGLSHKHTVLVLYIVSAIFGAGAVAIALTTQVDTIIFILLIIAGITLSGINKLKYKEIALLHNGIFLTFYNKMLINRQHFQKVLDSVFIVVAFVCAYLLTQTVEFAESFSAAGQGIDPSIILFVCMLQVCVFWFSGFYRETIQQIGIADVFRILKLVGVAVIISTAGIYMAPFWHIENTFTFLIFNFYFLATFVLGVRILFHLLKHLFRCSRHSDRKAIIYGAGDQGMLTLQRLLTMNSGIHAPLGFLDDNPNLEGKLINGFPVFGGHWKLERLIRSHGIRYLFIATDQLNSEVQRRILKLAREYDLKIKKFQVQINEVPLATAESKNNQNKGILYAN